MSSTLAMCVLCESKDNTTPLVFLAFVLGACLIVAAIYVGGYPLPPFVVRHVVYRSLTKLDKGSMQVCWSTYQIISTIAWNLSVEFPPPFSSFLSLLSFLQLDFLSLDCVSGQNSFFNRLYVVFLCPIAAAIAILLVYFIRVHMSPASEEQQRLKTQHVAAFLPLTYLVLPPCSMVRA